MHIWQKKGIFADYLRNKLHRHMDILQQMLKRAQENPQRIVLPEGDEPRTLEAANILLKDNVANIILIGNPQRIQEMAT